MTIMDQMTKMTMNSERTKYMEYLRLLIDLNKSGYKCLNEIKTTLDRLHGMMFEPPAQKFVRKYACPIEGCNRIETKENIHEHTVCICEVHKVVMQDRGLI